MNDEPSDPQDTGTQDLETGGSQPGRDFTPSNQPPSAGGPVPLHEMSLGKLLDYAIKIYRYRWKTFLGISAGIVIPYAALQAIFTALFGPDPADLLAPTPGTVPSSSFEGIWVPLLFGLGMFAFLQPFLTGAMAKATSEIYLGRSPTAGDILRYTASIFPSLLLISLLVFLTVIGGIFLLIIGAIIFSVRFYLSPVALVAEGLRGRDGLRRAWSLTKGEFGRVFGALFVSNLLIAVVAGIITFPLGAIGGAIGGDAGIFVTTLAESIGQVLTIPFAGIVAVLIYYDLRIRKEAYDLALMAQELGNQAPPMG